MDEIQKVLIKAGRKDLAQEYYKKIARGESADLGAIGITTMSDGENGVVIEIDGQQFKFSKLGIKKLIDKLKDISKKL